jgi:predicted RNase H-like HicB family nuclease
MSAKSKRSSPEKGNRRSFAPDVLAKARDIADRYQVILTHEEGHWYGRGLELPRVFGDGATPAACIDETREALIGAVAYLLERGERPPASAREGVRSMQINVRVTAEEKALLEATARRKGYAGISDFVRAAALESTL